MGVQNELVSPLSNFRMEILSWIRRANRQGRRLPFILGLRDQDRLGTHGANQKENSISFGDGPSQKIVRDLGHLWLRWGTKMNVCSPRWSLVNSIFDSVIL